MRDRTLDMAWYDWRCREPTRFCEFLRRKCEALGVNIVLGARPKSISNAYDGSPSLEIQKHDKKFLLPCENLVISAGPWSERVLAVLFPSKQIRIPFDLNSGNQLILSIPNSTNERKDYCDQVYLQGVLQGKRIDISDFLDGNLYVGGYLSGEKELPENVGEVKPQRFFIEKMKQITGKLLNVSDSSHCTVIEEGRAYRPIMNPDRPIITEVSLNLLQATSTGLRIFVNVGHGSNGITLAPGSGKVMADLIRDVQPVVDISGLGFPQQGTGSLEGTEGVDKIFKAQRTRYRL